LTKITFNEKLKYTSDMRKRFPVILILLISPLLSGSRHVENILEFSFHKKVFPGADQVEEYLPYLKGKRVGMLVNQTSIIGNKSIVDSLRSLKVDIKIIFGPEHGFRANASNGARVADEVDAKTGIPIISLYGQKRKPSKKDMDFIDIMIFDIQDVGSRFYTNINTLYNVMKPARNLEKN